MKKAVKHIICMGAAVLTLSSCSLDLTPESTMTDESFWNTETDLRGACNRFYEQMNGNNDLGTGFSHDYRSDELTTGGSNNTSAGLWTVPSTSGSWTDAYWRIFIANNILTKSEKAKVSEEVRNRYDAEARFFRAYYYFELVKKYGDVPLLLKAINSTKDPDLNMPRTPREDVLTQVYKDLDFACTWLPDIDNAQCKDANWGHVSRQAAYAMIVRVGLYEGTWGKYHKLQGCDYKAHLNRSIAAAETLIGSGKFGLYDNFEELFQDKAEGRSNRENIFVKVYGPNGGSASTTHGFSRTMENTAKVTRNIIDLFLYTDGLPMAKSPLKVAVETSFDDVFKNRDPRLAMTCYMVGEDAYKGPYNPFGFGTAYNIKKGFDLKQWETNSKEWTDKMIIRYAEVLISYAEALYEHNDKITDDQLEKTVNALRRRVGMPTMLTNAFVSANGLNMRDEIRRERTVEFIDENKRYDDIIRWKIAENVLPVDIIGAKFTEEANKSGDEYKSRLTDANGNNKGKLRYGQENMYVIEYAEDRKFDPNRDYLYPVPLQEISLSGGAVTQNPGW